MKRNVLIYVNTGRLFHSLPIENTYSLIPYTEAEADEPAKFTET